MFFLQFLQQFNGIREAAFGMQKTDSEQNFIQQSRVDHLRSGSRVLFDTERIRVVNTTAGSRRCSRSDTIILFFRRRKTVKRSLTIVRLNLGNLQITVQRQRSRFERGDFGESCDLTALGTELSASRDLVRTLIDF